MALAETPRSLRYYWQELSYLRKMGHRFALRYPKVAGRLELNPEECPDPHVERLIESFAFLTGRVQQSIDNHFPEVASELLEILYPHYLKPVPSMTVARIEADPEEGKLTTGHLVAKHTPLFTHTRDGQVVRFRTCYPVHLWPVRVSRATFESPDRYDFLDRETGIVTVLRLRIEGHPDALADLPLERLRFYLNADRVLVSNLYERLFGDLRRIVLLPDTGRPHFLPPETLKPVGFSPDEEVLPYPRYSHPAYRLVQEYFTFPEKFHFFDVTGLQGHGAERSLDLLFLLDRAPEKPPNFGPETFSLGCTPIINLFRRLSEPIRIDHRSLEYRLVADYRREKTTEIHSIRSVSESSDFGEHTRRFEGFYSFSHPMERRKHRAFWHARRVPAVREDVDGTDLLLSFVDLDFQPRKPPADVVFAHLLCTNRNLAEQMPAGALLETDEVTPRGRILCLKKPTFQIDPPLGGQTLWRLISHLSLNHLSLGEGEDSLKALREILRLYCPEGDDSGYQQILGLAAMSQRKIVHRLGQDAWRGFVKGTEVSLTLDESLYVGASAFLMASVLNHFFAQYAATNSFTRLVLHSSRREGVWKRWPAMAGERILL
jgi:type VI secretion system protein ImpG